ncbi:hypothetical protein SCA6_012466 [Theobroma cacao]
MGEKEWYFFSLRDRKYPTGDEWVVCRVFQKSAGVKKYPSNQSRAVNPYNLEIGASVMPPAMMQAENYQFSMGRNYAELAELSRVLRGGPSTTVNLPIQSQINYPGGFTISGLNLNLGGASTQQVIRPMQPPPPPATHQQDVTATMMSATSFTAENGYGTAELNNANGPSNRFLSMDHCMDLDNYWATY